MIRHPAIPYIAPFALFLFFLAIRGYLPHEYAVRVLVTTAVLLIFSRGVVSLRPLRPASSILAGVLVFAVWIGPDLIWPAYRQHWLFHNILTGAARSSLPENIRTDRLFLLFRIAGTVLLVPVIEELFWRGWLMRYLISPDFQKIRLGAYAALSFWLTAVLFASEHGPYWDVGLLAGIVYNWWMIRTGSLGDCILAHAITNGCLAAYVLAAGQWQYWL
ncbi:MAG: CAAX prenyl protease-related protein [Acidobacteriia bacterium]|nr:CAAX prenyl protease-related protein [Terriglobia bacterium]